MNRDKQPVKITACLASLFLSTLIGLIGQSGAGASAQQAKPAPPPDKVYEVSATVETEPVANAGDAADDPAIWVNPTDPAKSTIIGTNKDGGLAVYDLSGKQIQYLPDGSINNVDLRAGFKLGGQTVTLVTAGNRTDNSIAIYRVNQATRMLENVAARKVTTLPVYGSCMYHSRKTGKFYYFVNSKQGAVEQWELFDNGSGKVDGRKVRGFAAGSQTEGCVADDELGHFYLGEEEVAIWKYGAEPDAGDARTPVDKVHPDGHVVSNIEGLTIAYGQEGAGYLIASSQGNSTFVIYRRERGNQYVRTFKIVDGNGIDGVSETDGIDCVTANLGPAFPHGVFVTQDGFNDNGNQNFKLVPLHLVIGDGANTQAANQSQSPAPASAPAGGQDGLAGKLPPALRARGQALLNEKNDQERADLAENLGEEEPVAALEFLVALLESDPAAAVRDAIIDQLGDAPAARMQQALAQLAAADPDVKVALAALDKLRAHRMREALALLARRTEMAKQKGDAAELRALWREQERWIALVNGTMLPAFLRATPLVFSLKEAGQPVRVLTLGDFGYGSPANRRLAGDDQKRVAAAMLQSHRQSPFDFGLTLGDNFYPDGMESPTDDRWQTLWRELYEPLGLKFYATLGNHDWHHADSPAAEILHSHQSASWRMPAPYYTFTAGPAQFFALDTNEVSEAQLLWLKGALSESRARWKVVYGHHPIYSAGRHQDNASLIERLLPVLKDRVDVYLAGHDHDLQHLKPEGGVHFFVNGGGGARVRKIEMGTRSLFAKDAHGFAVLEADTRQLKVKFLDTSLNQLYEYVLTKPEPAGGNSTR